MIKKSHITLLKKIQTFFSSFKKNAKPVFFIFYEGLRYCTIEISGKSARSFMRNFSLKFRQLSTTKNF
jgi:hypothetical protein